MGGDGTRALKAKGRRIRISSEAPLLAILEMLAFAGTFLVKPAPREDDENALIGTGPFMVDTMSEALRLVRNPHHAGPRAAIESITFRDYANEAELADAVAKANVDFTVALAPKDLPAGSFVRTSYLPTPSTAILFMNAERLPDSRLRQAIAMSIERGRLLDLGYPGATGLSAKGTFAGQPGTLRGPSPPQSTGRRPSAGHRGGQAGPPLEAIGDLGTEALPSAPACRRRRAGAATQLGRLAHRA